MSDWRNINRLGKNRLLGTSYFWLVVVPILAKLLSIIENPLDFTHFVPGLKIDLNLPFSWQLFYFSAVMISIAGAIYHLCCPKIIKYFNDFSDYQKEGRGSPYLISYSERLKNFTIEGDASRLVDEPIGIDHEQRMLLNAMLFWQIYEYEKVTSPVARFICFSLYIIGILLLLIVLFDNFLFVIEQTY